MKRNLINSNVPKLHSRGFFVDDTPILSFKDGIEVFLKENERKGLSKETNKFYLEKINNFLSFFNERYHKDPPLILNEYHIVAYYDYNVNELGLSRNGFMAKIRGIKRYYNFLVERSVIEENLLNRYEFGRLNDTPIESFTKNEIERLFDVCDTRTFVGYRDYVIMLVLLDTGIRLRELTDLLLKDTDVTEGYITVLGKNGKYRTIPISNGIISILRAYINNVRGDSPSKYLFITIHDKQMTRKAVQDRIGIYGRLAKINKQCSPHIFRHTFAKMFIQNGGGTFALQEMLGHSSLEMVKKYVRLYSSDIKKEHTLYNPLNSFRR